MDYVSSRAEYKVSERSVWKWVRKELFCGEKKKKQGLEKLLRNLRSVRKKQQPCLVGRKEQVVVQGRKWVEHRKQFDWHIETMWEEVKEMKKQQWRQLRLWVEFEAGSHQSVSPRGSIPIRIWQGAARCGGPGPNIRLKSVHWDQHQLESR